MRRVFVVGISVALLLAFAVELVVPREPHGDLPVWHTTPGWFAGYGVVGCVALVAVAKLLGALGLTRPGADAITDDGAPRDPAAPDEEP